MNMNSLSSSDRRIAKNASTNKFFCEGNMKFREACSGENLYKEDNGKQYCILHYPGQKNSQAFKNAFKRKLDNRNYDFRGFWFPKGIEFEDLQLDGNADFSNAIFQGRAIFINTKFLGKTIFDCAFFYEGANFSGANFQERAAFCNVIF